jgi:pimeloyl-ACP methyl ester carboxylesterase
MVDSASAKVLRRKRPWYHPIELLKRVVVYALIAYIIIAVYLAFMQTRLTYYGYTQPVAPADAVQQAKAVGLIPWEHTTPGASGPQGFVPPDFASPAPRGTIVFFHGNGESAWNWAGEIAAFKKRGFRVFMYEYPGYGSRPGVPSEKLIVPDAQAVVRSLDQAGYGPIYLWGVSLGSGVAAAVAADATLPVKGLGLVCPWDDLGHVGQSYYPWLPVRLLLFDKYDSVANLEHFPHPVCVMRGDRDETIYPALTLNLFAHLPEPKKMILQSGYGHGDWPDSPDQPFWNEALDFIAPR